MSVIYSLIRHCAQINCKYVETLHDLPIESDMLLTLRGVQIPIVDETSTKITIDVSGDDNDFWITAGGRVIKLNFS